jgi:hypothetical protein
MQSFAQFIGLLMGVTGMNFKANDTNLQQINHPTR